MHSIFARHGKTLYKIDLSTGIRILKKLVRVKNCPNVKTVSSQTAQSIAEGGGGQQFIMMQGGGGGVQVEMKEIWTIWIDYDRLNFDRLMRNLIV